MSVTVVVADDNDDIRALVRLTLELDGRFDVVGEAVNGREAIELAESSQPDVVVLDLQMPVLDGARALPLILDVAPATAVVVFTAYYTDEVGDRLLADGAVRVLTKTSRPAEIADVLFDVVTERATSKRPFGT